MCAHVCACLHACVYVCARAFVHVEKERERERAVRKLEIKLWHHSSGCHPALWIFQSFVGLELANYPTVRAVSPWAQPVPASLAVGFHMHATTCGIFYMGYGD